MAPGLPHHPEGKPCDCAALLSNLLGRLVVVDAFSSCHVLSYQRVNQGVTPSEGKKHPDKPFPPFHLCTLTIQNNRFCRDIFIHAYKVQ